MNSAEMKLMTPSTMLWYSCELVVWVQLSAAVNVRLKPRLTFSLKQVTLNTPCLTLHLQQIHRRISSQVCFFPLFDTFFLFTCIVPYHLSASDILPASHPIYQHILHCKYPVLKLGGWTSELLLFSCLSAIFYIF